MQLNRWQVHFQQAHVLDNQGIHTDVIQLPHQLARFLKFSIVKNGIDGRENTGVIAVGKFHQLGDVRDRIGCICARAKHGATQINRVCAVQNRLATNFHVACGG